MNDGDQDLEALAKTLRALKDLVPQVAKQSAPAILAEVQRTAAAGVSATGQSWDTKKDGSRALPNAAGALSVVTSRNSVTVVLKGAYVFHHQATGKIRRPILPEPGEVPPAIAAIIADAVEAARKRAGA